MGAKAAEAASAEAVEEGCVGAGTGATVGKVLGMRHAMKGGVGSWSAPVGNGGAKVAALAAVNAYGDVVHPRTKTIIAGARTGPDSREFANAIEVIRRGKRGPSLGGNTTLVAVATNARLSKVEATRLAKLAQHGLVQSIAPVHTMFDGDIVFALSTGNETVDFTALAVVAAEVVAEAVIRAVRYAWTTGGVPGLAPVPAALATPR
jgi:L-aminopeptidase/D-esterase-like protein